MEARDTSKVRWKANLAADEVAGPAGSGVGGRVFLAIVGARVSVGSKTGGSVGRVGWSTGLNGVGATEGTGTTVGTAGESEGIFDGVSEGAADGGGSMTRTLMIIPKLQ